MEASVATPSQGAPPAPAQPATAGQGGGGGSEPTAAGKGEFNWGLFPNVPENQRELLQPHLTNVLGHVTKMEQQYAPYKGVLDAVPPDQVQNLLQFLQNYQTDPMATWYGLAQSLQEDGLISNPEFSIDQLQAMAQGQAQGEQTQPGMEDMPPWAQQMAQQLQMMTQAEEARQQQEQQRQAEAEAQQQEQMLAQAQQTIRESLKGAGVPEGLVTDEQVIASLIAHKGDMDAVVHSFTGLRDGFLKGFTEQNGSGPKAPSIRGETPQAPKGGLPRKSGDAFREATIGAQQMLAQTAAAEGQGN